MYYVLYNTCTWLYIEVVLPQWVVFPITFLQKEMTTVCFRDNDCNPKPQDKAENQTHINIFSHIMTKCKIYKFIWLQLHTVWLLIVSFDELWSSVPFLPPSLADGAQTAQCMQRPPSGVKMLQVYPGFDEERCLIDLQLQRVIKSCIYNNNCNIYVKQSSFLTYTFFCSKLMNQ